MMGLSHATPVDGRFQIANATDPASAMAQYGQNGNQITNDQLALAGTSHIYLTSSISLGRQVLSNQGFKGE